jgi:hypothetical protein
MMKCGKNNITVAEYVKALHPGIMDKPDFERVAIVFAAVRYEKFWAVYEEVMEALAEFLPEQKEFWLRVLATVNIRFVEGMTAMFEADLTTKG